MKYYSEPLTYSQSVSNSQDTTIDYNNVVEKLKNNYILSDVKHLSQQLHPLTQQLKNILFYRYTNEIFENVYTSRFVLPQQQFCEIQHFIFNNPQGKGGNPLVFHLDSYFKDSVDCYQQFSKINNISDYLLSNIENYYTLAKQSEDSIFSQKQIDLLALNEKIIFRDFCHNTPQLIEFISFAKHTIAFNIFKDFLLYPEKVNPDYLLKVLPFVSLKNNDIPILDELCLFSKLMEQEHWEKISSFPQANNVEQFLEKIFFFSQPRVNSKPTFYYSNQTPYNDKIIHLFNYDILDTINQKNINLNVLFNYQTQYRNFSTFVLSNIENQLKNTDLIYDEEGYQHLLTLLKVQDYLYLNDKFPKKNISENHIKI